MQDEPFVTHVGEPGSAARTPWWRVAYDWCDSLLHHWSNYRQMLAANAEADEERQKCRLWEYEAERANNARYLADAENERLRREAGTRFPTQEKPALTVPVQTMERVSLSAELDQLPNDPNDGGLRWDKRYRSLLGGTVAPNVTDRPLPPGDRVIRACGRVGRKDGSRALTNAQIMARARRRHNLEAVSTFDGAAAASKGMPDP